MPYRTGGQGSLKNVVPLCHTPERDSGLLTGVSACPTKTCGYDPLRHALLTGSTGGFRHMADNGETPQGDAKFDFSNYPADTLFHERRTGRDRRVDPAQESSPILAPESSSVPVEKRAKKE